MIESFTEESFLDDEYGYNLPSPTPNELQKLKEADTSFGEFSFILFVFEFKICVSLYMRMCFFIFRECFS